MKDEKREYMKKIREGEEKRILEDEKEMDEGKRGERVTGKGKGKRGTGEGRKK